MEKNNINNNIINKIINTLPFLNLYNHHYFSDLYQFFQFLFFLQFSHFFFKISDKSASGFSFISFSINSQTN